MTGTSDPAQDLVRFEEVFGGGARAILGLAGLPLLLPPWELLVRPGGATFDAATLLTWLVSAGALAVCLPLLGVALVGFRTTVTVDPREGTLSERTGSSFGLAWTRRQAPVRVSEIRVRPEVWSDGSVAWSVVALFKDGTSPWRLTRCVSRDDALVVVRDIAARSRLASET